MRREAQRFGPPSISSVRRQVWVRATTIEMTMASEDSVGLSPGFNSAEVAHAWRVAAWCAAIAAKLELPAVASEAVERAAILHQRSKLVIDDSAWEALCDALGLRLAVREGAGASEDEAEVLALTILKVLQGDREAPMEVKQLAWIVERCDHLDNACEMEARVSSDPDLTGLEAAVAAVADYLRGVTPADVERAARRIPVFPAIAQQALQLLSSEGTHAADLERLISSDPTLAGHIVAAANSAAIGGRGRVAALSHAIARIGFTVARQIVSGSAIRGMYGARYSQTLWNHSLEVAETARGLAEQTGRVDPDHAFLAGLLHDVGKLVMLGLAAASRASYEQLARKGCPDVVVERVVFGEAHPSVGARLLRAWHFAEPLVLAVEHHHEPERDEEALTAVIYLAERAARRDEGLESEWRDELARRLVGFNGPLEVAPHGPVWSELRFSG